MPAITIDRLRRISADEGVLRPDSVDSRTPAFRRFNLVYGFNGSGKTSLSRAFWCLGNAAAHPRLPGGFTVEAELSDGTRISSNDASQALTGHMLVFNSDFIEENISWKDGIAKPVFYLGRKQIDLKKALERNQERLAALSSALSEKESDLKHSGREFATFKRTRAAQIESELHLTRGYRAPDLERDLAAGEFSEQDRLTDEVRREYRALLFSESVLPRRPSFPALPSEFVELIGATRQAVETSLDDAARTLLGDHVALVDWIKRGADYHHEHGLSTCLFCDGPLSDSRLAELSSAIGHRYLQFMNNMESLRQRLDVLHEELQRGIAALPSENDLDTSLRDRARIQLGELRVALEEVDGMAKSAAEFLSTKRMHPGSPVDVSGLHSPEELARASSALEDTIRAVNVTLVEHNALADDRHQHQSVARERLKRNCLGQVREEFARLKAEVDAKEKAVRQNRESREAAEREIEELTRRVREHGPAADRMTSLIQSYLGHDELRVGLLDDGYQLLRRERPVLGPLSEGEKTALALCYFIVSVEAEGRKLRDLILVVDDPISSLDTRALNYAFSLVRASFSRAAQLFILTHNVNFMNTTKKWLKAKAAGDDPTAVLLFLDVRRPDERQSRVAKLSEMPKYIREYESEYHYLFHLLLGFVEGSEGGNYFYAVPNALRKALEVFFAFRFPGSSGFETQLDLAAREAPTLDAARISALGRLAQVASHGDNLESLVDFPAMTLEEARGAAEAWVDLLKVLDPEHFKRMCKICR